jgi:hypothetical protein
VRPPCYSSSFGALSNARTFLTIQSLQSRPFKLSNLEREERENERASERVLREGKDSGKLAVWHSLEEDTREGYEAREMESRKGKGKRERERERG